MTFGALLLVLPFSGIRVICVESPLAVDASASAGPAESHTDDAALTECERMCPFHPPASMQAPDAETGSATSDDDSNCALSSDAAALQMLGTIAVLGHAPRLVVPLVITDAPVEVITSYAEPALIHSGPPPKPPTL